MMKQFLFTVSFLILGIFAFSIENYPSGARSLALSHASVSFSDVWSTFHNQAGLTGVNAFSAGFFYESKFQIEELSLVSGALVLPTASGNFGVSFFQFGEGNFKENKFGLAFSKLLTKRLGAGIQLDYLSQTFPENSRSKGFVTIEGGAIFSASEDLVFGAHVFNPFLRGIETLNGKQKVPAVFRLGGRYHFDTVVLLAFEAEKNSRNPLLMKTGVEFKPVENLALRFGVSGKPFKYTAGLGYTFGKVTTDIGFSYHGNLGFTPSVSLQFNL
ncbi:hypothetical protein GM418_16015 [Maribellus comscasis]|uniref:Uncharacterized protein n=1 Tax=Maribellus comscasis TaxID=2681766 RepID=A0A6I6JV24_9BACT|nr:hypothetical protein [Maribellus comscasis]QGY45119.1 hypothetical protein GM418_16015 [Maribellus comscasis]